MKKNIQLLLLLGTLNLFGFEVNTHQAITRCAIIANTPQCETKGAENLKLFATHANLLDKDYIYQQFEKYGKTYVEYAREGTGFNDWKIEVNSNYLGLIETGVILEDAVYHNEDKLLKGGDGRFNNHFYADQFDSREACEGIPGIELQPFLGVVSHMKTSKALCLGYAHRTDNIDWVFNKNVNLKWKGLDRKNDYGIDDAFDYFKKSFIGTHANMKKYQAKLFVSLGFMIHMIQDLHSPAHVRDGSHPLGDYLEIYGRYDGGFNLRDGVRNSNNNYFIEKAIRDLDIDKIMLKDNKFVSYEDFYRKEARWVSNNFVSEAHLTSDSPNAETGNGLSINNFLDNDTIFDSYNSHPSRGETSEGGAIHQLENWRYILTDGNTVSRYVNGNINSFNRIAMVEKSIFGNYFDSEHMLAPVYQKNNGKYKLLRVNNIPLRDTAINVMPRAVASTQAFINFFFRGQMEASLSADHTKLVIKNVSVKEGRVHHDKLLTFKRGGKFTLYVDKGGISTAIQTVTLGSDMKMNETRSMNISNHNLAVGTKVTVVYDGKIGDDMGGYNQYGIGMRGLSADVFNLSKKIPCTDEEKLVMEDVKWLKKYLNNRVLVSNIQNRYSNHLKHVSTCRNTSKTAWEVRYNIKYGECTNIRNISSTIDYFNKNIYGLVIETPPAKDQYWASASWEGYDFESTPGTSVGLSLSVNINKNRDFYGTEYINEFVRLAAYDGSLHFRDSTKSHYDIWCRGSREMCRYVKYRVRADGNAYGNEPKISAEDVDWTVFSYGIYRNEINLFLSNIKTQVERYYGRGNNPPDLNSYPSDWIFKFKNWITNVDLEECSSLRTSKMFIKVSID